MALRERMTAVLAKIETTYGTDSVPSGAANALLVSGQATHSLDMKRVERDLVRPYLGNSESLTAAIFKRVEFSVEAAGSGAAGTAPAWGVLLRACGFQQTITAGVKAEYKPVSENIESVTIYLNEDGVLHALKGARGDVSFTLDNGAIPTLRFSFQGLYVPVTDAALPTVDLTSWKRPLVVSRLNTPTFSVHGYSPKMNSFSLQMNNQVAADSLVGGSGDEILITDRKPIGNLQIEAVTVAQKDWFGIIAADTTGAVQLVHGTTAGNIVQFDMPTVQLLDPRMSALNGRRMLQASLKLTPGTSGNDEIVITAK
jgi:hypothetical protein